MHSARSSAAIKTRRLLSVITALCMVQTAATRSQQPSSPQPLNATVSDFGTSFAFSPPICAGCVRDRARVPLPPGRPLCPGGAHRGSRLAARRCKRARQCARFRGPARTPFHPLRQPPGLRHSRKSAWTAMAWCSRLRRGAQPSSAASRADAPGLSLSRSSPSARTRSSASLASRERSASRPETRAPITWKSFDYTRSIGERGYNIFAGLQHELTAGEQTIGIEEGMTIPFRNGQVELATEQLTLNTDPAVQFQARVIVNWGKLLSRRPCAHDSAEVSATFNGWERPARAPCDILARHRQHGDFRMSEKTFARCAAIHRPPPCLHRRCSPRLPPPTSPSMPISRSPLSVPRSTA